MTGYQAAKERPDEGRANFSCSCASEKSKDGEQSEFQKRDQMIWKNNDPLCDVLPLQACRLLTAAGRYVSIRSGFGAKTGENRAKNNNSNVQTSKQNRFVIQPTSQPAACCLSSVPTVSRADGRTHTWGGTKRLFAPKCPQKRKEWNACEVVIKSKKVGTSSVLLR